MTSKKTPSDGRTRATQACLMCRQRKVRCNVTISNGPCLNCVLDNKECVVTQRARPKLGSRRNGPRFLRDLNPTGSIARPSENPSPEKLPVGSAELDQGTLDHGDHGDRGTSSEQESSSWGSFDDHMSDKGVGDKEDAQDASCSFINEDSDRDRDYQEPSQVIDRCLLELSTELSYRDATSIGFNRLDSPQLLNTTVPFYAYGNIKVSNLRRMDTEDINYLDMMGCLRVPVEPVLGCFLRQYFLYVHPFLPVLSEDQFWDLMDDSSDRARSEDICQHVFPLLIIKAIMFAASAYVPLGTLQMLGYASAREARRNLYKQTRWLYRLKTESSDLCNAQAALLLSLWSPPFAEATDKTNTAWVSKAIKKARSMRAHKCTSKSKDIDSSNQQKLVSLRRLWGCCVIRDCILSIGLRRSCQIRQGIESGDSKFIINLADLEPEFCRSRVYGHQSKMRLADLFLRLVELCMLHGQVSPLLCPSSVIKRQEAQIAMSKASEISVIQYEEYLEGWDKGINSSKSGGRIASNYTENNCSTRTTPLEQQSIILFTNLLYLYYHSSQIAVGNYRMLQSIVQARYPSVHNRVFSDIVGAATGIVSRLQTLIDLQLLRFLPTSAIPCTAFPLALHAVNCKLGSPLQSSQIAVLTRALRTYGKIYDGVEWVTEAIGHILRQKNLKQLARSTSGPNPITATTWETIMVEKPAYYLRITMTVDLAFGEGRLPQETEFPSQLQEASLDYLSQAWPPCPTESFHQSEAWMPIEMNLSPLPIASLPESPSTHSPFDIEAMCADQLKAISENDLAAIKAARSTTGIDSCSPSALLSPGSGNEMIPLFDVFEYDTSIC